MVNIRVENDQRLITVTHPSWLRKKEDFLR
jgi:hypothetical protein